MSKKILLTGASGFIGEYLIRELETREIDYLAIDAKKSYKIPETNQQVVSILDYEQLVHTLEQYKPDAIIHLAAIALATYENVPEIYNVNVCGTENLFRACIASEIQLPRIVLISTAGVYGNQGEILYSEDLPYHPENHYSYSKMVAEFLAKQYADLDIKVVRPFNIVGVGQRNVFLIPKLVEHFAEKKEELHIGNLEPQRDYVDVEYCAYVLAELALRKDVEFDVYNICSGIGRSVRDVINILEKHSGYCPKIVIDPKFVRKNEVWRLVGSPERLQHLIGTRKCQDFERVLIDMYENYAKSK